LEADLDKRDFIKIHQETFGKTGCRRIVPGEYLAADPKGRAIMIGAVEKQKFVYLTSRDSENRMTISSPLEAHKSNTICFDLTSLDVGYENPQFVSLEVEYGDFENENSTVNTGEYNKLLVYYEMDLGLNHVVRKNAEIVDKTAHLLIPIPGTNDGPGGVLVCYEDYIMYKGNEERITPLPRRNESNRGLMIINYTIYKKPGLFFFLAQSEIGDIYKISLNYTGQNVHGLQIQYFDTIPVSVSLSLIPGFILASSESGNQYIFINIVIYIIYRV
jgi:splicing factor 3B subunit 3